MFGIVVNEQGYKVEFVVLNKDKSPRFYELKDGESIIEQDWSIANSMNKPQWNVNEWIDTDPLPPVEIPPSEPSQMEVLTAKVAEQDITCANLLLEIALLKGGPQNVV